MKKMNQIFKSLVCIGIFISISSKALSEGLTSPQPGSSESLIVDTEYLIEMADLILEDIELKLAKKISMKELSTIKRKFREAAYLVTRASTTTEAFLNSTLIDYPDVVKVDLGLHLTSMLLTPILIFYGQPALAGLIHIPGITDGIAGAYFLTREWIKKRSALKKFGIDPNATDRFKINTFTTDEVKSINLHIIEDELESLDIPVATKKRFSSKSAKPSADYIAVHELEAVIADPDFLHSAKMLNLEPSLYEGLLIQKICSEPGLKRPFLARVRDLNPRKNERWSNWIEATESFSNRIRSEIMLQGFDKSRLFGSESKKYVKEFWSARHDRKAIYQQIRDIEEFQFETLALLLTDKSPDYDQAKAQFEKARSALISSFNEFKEKYPNMTKPSDSRESAKVTRTCRELFAQAL